MIIVLVVGGVIAFVALIACLSGFANSLRALSSIEPQLPAPAAPPPTPQPSLFDYSPKAHASPPSPPPTWSPPPPPIRDTKVAINAMEIAHAYMREVHDDVFDALKDPTLATGFLNTLALASKQIVIAEQNDPDATVTIENKDGTPLTLNLRELKAHTLFYEGIARTGEDPKRGVKVLEQACAIAPEAGNFFYWTGLVHASLFNKPQAVAAFVRAVAIDPANIDYRKELDRAQNITDAQVAFDRAASAARTTANVARWIPILFLVFCLLALAIAIFKGDATTIVGIIVLFVFLGAILKGVDFIKAWFRANT